MLFDAQYPLTSKNSPPILPAIESNTLSNTSSHRKQYLIKLWTTTPVLTEAFHMLAPGSTGSDRLREFVAKGGLVVWFLDRPGLVRAFELMDRYADHPMDLADASLIVAAETLGTQTIFTLDRGDFETYRIRRGHRQLPVQFVR